MTYIMMSAGDPGQISEYGLSENKPAFRLGKLAWSPHSCVTLGELFLPFSSHLIRVVFSPFILLLP